MGIIFSLFCLFTSLSFAENFTYEDLSELIQKRNSSKIEDVLGNLPKGVKFYSTYMEDTGSTTQEASAKNPRAIVFTEDSSLILTFNGHHSQEGYDTLEVMQWRPKKRKLELRSIQFPEGGKPQFSKANPQKCATCHGADPIWQWKQAYFWHGAYGGVSDQQGPGEFLEFHDGQTDRYIAFRDKARTHPRYKHFQKKSVNPVWPYARDEKERFTETTEMPNSHFTKTMINFAAFRASRLIQESKEFEKLTYLTVFSLACTDVLFDRAEWFVEQLGADPDEVSLDQVVLEKLGLSTAQLNPSPSPTKGFPQLHYRDGLSDWRGGASTLRSYVASALVAGLSNTALKGVKKPPTIGRKELIVRNLPDYEKIIREKPVIASIMKTADKMLKQLDLKKEGKAFCEFLEAKAIDEIKRLKEKELPRGRKVGHQNK